jgi:hypothetical protein
LRRVESHQRDEREVAVRGVAIAAYVGEPIGRDAAPEKQHQIGRRTHELDVARTEFLVEALFVAVEVDRPLTGTWVAGKPNRSPRPGEACRTARRNGTMTSNVCRIASPASSASTGWAVPTAFCASHRCIAGLDGLHSPPEPD